MLILRVIFQKTQEMGKENYAVRHLYLIFLLNTVDYN